MSTDYPICATLGLTSSKYIRLHLIELDLQLYPTRATKDFRKMFNERWTPRQIMNSWLVDDWIKDRREIGGSLFSGVREWAEIRFYQIMMEELLAVAKNLPDEIYQYMSTAAEEMDDLLQEDDEGEESDPEYKEGDDDA
jgi:hypothetical protein